MLQVLWLSVVAGDEVRARPIEAMSCEVHVQAVVVRKRGESAADLGLHCGFRGRSVDEDLDNEPVKGECLLNRLCVGGRVLHRRNAPIVVALDCHYDCVLLTHRDPRPQSRG